MTVPAHFIVDPIAIVLSGVATVVAYRTRIERAATVLPDQVGGGYAAALVVGAAVGGYALGTLNLWLTGVHIVGRSTVGALAGAIVGVELYKRRRGVRGSSGLAFVPGYCVSIAVGRIGCFLSGLSDETYGTPTALPWGHDFGDGIARHPVQLYESGAMALFLVGASLALWWRSPLFARSGFYLMVGFYAAQRFAWEFLKPYAPVAGPLNVFHLVCVLLFVYAVVMVRRSDDGRS